MFLSFTSDVMGSNLGPGDSQGNAVAQSPVVVNAGFLTSHMHSFSLSHPYVFFTVC